MTSSSFKFPAVLNFGSDGAAVVTAFNPDTDLSNGPIFIADERHPHFTAILEGLRAGDDSVWALFDVVSGVLASFSAITERVSIDSEKNILWDGDPVHSVLADQLSRAIEDGNPDNYRALALFWEKLESNPNEHSRTQAYDWLSCHKFQITSEGDVVGYKGTALDENGEFVSTWASQVDGVPSAYVDGQPIAPLSVVPNKVGSVVSMPRSEVVHDPRQACKRGLHVSTRSYAESYVLRGGAILEVHVNPRDIVSVPTDGAGAKVRACRYYIARVSSEANHNPSTPVLREDAPKTYWAGDVGYRA